MAKNLNEDLERFRSLLGYNPEKGNQLTEKIGPNREEYKRSLNEEDPEEDEGGEEEAGFGDEESEEEVEDEFGTASEFSAADELEVEDEEVEEVDESLVIERK